MRSRLGLFLRALAVLLASTAIARARSGLDGDDVATLFSIRKSENHNRVDYGLRIGADCRVTGASPVVPYWRMLELDGAPTQPLRAMERRAYGVASQSVDATGARVALRLRALGSRTIDVVVSRAGERCVAEATTTIGGARSVIEDIYVAQSGALSVDHVMLRGRALRSGAQTSERLEP